LGVKTAIVKKAEGFLPVKSVQGDEIKKKNAIKATDHPASPA